MSFVPQTGTPLATTTAAGDEAELLSIAVLRLAMPERLIPASLDVAGIDGLERRLQAGANVVTSLVPPGSGLLGVSQAELGIDEGERSVASVVPRLEGSGPATRLRTRSTAIAWPHCARAARRTGFLRLLVLGGRLQGTEAVYLAAKAGYETLLMDRSPAPPAAGLADRHVVADITADERASRSLARTCDAILPACEDEATLEWLTERAPRWGVPLLFDMAAWRVTRSKAASRRLFASLGVARPDPWPACGFPVVVKPDGASGSYGVSMAHDEPALTAASTALAAAGHEVVVEEYLSGPSLSLEVLGWNGRGLPLQVTGLEFDSVYDCKRVVAPVGEVAAGGPAAAGLGRSSLARGLPALGTGTGRGVRRSRPLRRDERAPRRGPGAERHHGRRGRGA